MNVILAVLLVVVIVGQSVTNLLIHRILKKMTKLADDAAALVAEVAELKTVAAGAVLALNGFPALVAAAVTKALADNDVDEAAATASIEAATADAKTAVDALQAAVVAGTPEEAPPSGGDTGVTDPANPAPEEDQG